MGARDSECVEFLQWALPRLRFRWSGFRKVRGQVCKRVRRRARELDLEDLAAYRVHLEIHLEEWRRLDGFCRIPISRFFRDRALFERLALAWRGATDRVLRCWSAGCAAGEEAWSLAILARHALPRVRLDILATDSAPHQLERAQKAEYGSSSLREVPEEWRAQAFERTKDTFVLRPDYRDGVRFELADVRTSMPDGPFELILCRYLAFTYFEESLQREILEGLVARLSPRGLLAIGRHERLPEVPSRLEDREPAGTLYRLATIGAEG